MYGIFFLSTRIVFIEYSHAATRFDTSSTWSVNSILRPSEGILPYSVSCFLLHAIGTTVKNRIWNKQTDINPGGILPNWNQNYTLIITTLRLEFTLLMAFPLFLQNLDENLKLIQSLSARSWVWKQTRYMYIWYRRYPCKHQPVIITCNHFEYYSFGDIAIIFLCVREISFFNSEISE